MNSPTRITPVAVENEEATEAWSGALFDRFVHYRDFVVAGLAAFGDAAMQLHPPRAGARVLDIGCGFGDTTQRLAAPRRRRGEAVGVDVSEPFVAAAAREARAAGSKTSSSWPATCRCRTCPAPSITSFRGWA